jgi:hypothetical protein
MITAYTVIYEHVSILESHGAGIARPIYTTRHTEASDVLSCRAVSCRVMSCRFVSLYGPRTHPIRTRAGS